MFKKYMTFRNITKGLITILITIWSQFEVIKQNGSWGLGGNILMPFLMIMVLWVFPEIVKEIVKGLNED